MKNIFFFLLLCIAGLAGTVFADQDTTPCFIKHEWHADNKEVWINLTIDDRLQFEDIFSILRLGKKLGAEIICSPLPGKEIIDSKGCVLKDISYEVCLQNTIASNMLDGTIITTTNWLDKKSAKIFFIKATNTFQLPTSRIDLSKDTEFTTFIDAVNEGMISWKKAR